MKIKIWGARGSIPTPLSPTEIEEKVYQIIYKMPRINTNDSEAVWAYIRRLSPLLRGTAGGNTSCVEVRAGEETIIIDAGSGVRTLGQKLLQGPCGQGKGTLHFLFSHPHWDHIQGFPFFTPAYIPGNRLFIYSVHDMEKVLTEQQRYLNFPVPLSFMQAEMTFIKLNVGEPFSIGPLQINSILNNHPGDSIGYRFEDQHSTFVYANDSEYKDLADDKIQAHLDFFKDADALVFDAQYGLRESWENKADWGHSSAMIGVDFARKAGVKRLLLFHHEPNMTDSELQNICTTALDYQAQNPDLPTCEVIVAYEGLTLNLTPTGALTWQIAPDGKAAVLTASTTFDEQGIDYLTKHLAHLAEEDASIPPVINLSQVEHLTTASLKALVSLSRQRQKGPFVLAAPSHEVERVIELGGYADYFAIYTTVERAKKAIEARESLNLPGQIIKDRYQIAEVISQGRLGTVLKVLDTDLDQSVALKLFSPSFTTQTISRFATQVEQIVNWKHSNLLPIFDWGYYEDRFFIVEELATGKTLRKRLTDTKKLILVDDALAIALDLMSVLAYAHSQGVVHGNLEPQDIFLTWEGVKVNGFGLGYLEANRNLIEAPMTFLAATHLTPEQILGQPLDARTDLYTLGIILYQLFTGQHPFEGDDEEAIMEAHLKQIPVPPRQLNGRLSRSIEHLILKLLAKNPNDRYANARQAYRVVNSLIFSGSETRQHGRQSLVGRERQAQHLQACWDKVQSGVGQLVFITGEAGIGKTTLAQQMATDSEAPVVLVGCCLEQEGNPAYHPFSEALRTYCATVPPELFEEENRRLMGNFVKIIPELHRIVPNLPEAPPLEPQQEQLRIMSSLTEFIKQACDDRPWFLILDDLQWADQSSLELLRYLGRHLPNIPMLLVGTYRDTDLDQAHPFQAVLQDLSRTLTYRHLSLERLSEAETGQIVQDILGQAVPKKLVKGIYQHTGGNPFYTQEIIKGLMDDGLIQMKDGAWQFPDLTQIRLPQSMFDAVESRIHYLSPATRDILSQAAILGQIFRFDDIVAMSGLSEWKVLEHIDLALERQLVQEVSGAGIFRFSHVEIYHVIYNDLGLLRQRRLHRRAGEAMEQRLDENPEGLAETLAHHFSKAGEIEKALYYTIDAGNQAKDAHANEAALEWYQQALAILAQLDPKRKAHFETTWLSVQESLGKVLMVMGQYDEALAHFSAVQNILETAPDSDFKTKRLASICRQIATIYRHWGKYDTGLDWLEKGLTILEGTPPSRETLLIYLLGGRIYGHQTKFEKAINWYLQCLEMAAEIENGAEEIIARTHSQLGSIYIQCGDLTKAIELCLESVRIYRQIDDIADLPYTYNTLALAYSRQGKWEKAHETYLKSLSIFQETGDVPGEGLVTNNLGDIHLLRGEWALALSYFKRGYTIAKQTSNVYLETLALINMAEVNIRQENWADVEPYLMKMEALLNEVDSDEFASDLARLWAKVYLNKKDIENALTYAKSAVSAAQKQDMPLEIGQAHRVLGQVYLAQTKNKKAQTEFEESLETFETIANTYEIAKSKLALVELHRQSKQLDMAQTYLTEAIETFKTLEAKGDLSKAQTLHKKLRLNP